jgi:hypothetical protein
VDLIGIEPMTSSMPWNDQKPKLLTDKQLSVGRVGKTGPVCYQCYQFATKNLTERTRAEPVGGAAQNSSSTSLAVVRQVAAQTAGIVFTNSKAQIQYDGQV